MESEELSAVNTAAMGVDGREKLGARDDNGGDGIDDDDDDEDAGVRNELDEYPLCRGDDAPGTMPRCFNTCASS